MTVVDVYGDNLLVTGTMNEVDRQIFDDIISLEIKDLGVVHKLVG